MNCSRLLLIALVWLAEVAGARAQMVNVRLEIQMVAVPNELALALSQDLQNPGRIDAAYDKIQTLLAQGTAKLIGWPIITTKSGNRAVIEAIEEVRYATEYEPPTVSVESALSSSKSAKLTPQVDVTSFEGVPSAFETRNVGVTFEVEPVIGPDGKTIDLNLVPQHVRLQGFRKHTLEKSGNKAKITVEQPQFETHKVTTSLSIRSGRRVLLGIYPTEEPPNHIEFFILKAEVVPVE